MIFAFLAIFKDKFMIIKVQFKGEAGKFIRNMHILNSQSINYFLQVF